MSIASSLELHKEEKLGTVRDKCEEGFTKIGDQIEGLISHKGSVEIEEILGSRDESYRWGLSPLKEFKEKFLGLVHGYLQEDFRNRQEAEAAAYAVILEIGKPFDEVVENQAKANKARRAGFIKEGTELGVSKDIDEILRGVSRSEQQLIDKLNGIRSRIYDEVFKPYIEAHK